MAARPALRRAYWSTLRRLIPAVPLTSLEHYRRFGTASLFRNPVTFTELILAKKLYDKNPAYTLTSDKYAVRTFVAERIGAEHLIPLYQAAVSFSQLRWPELPDSFVLKATHGSGMNLIVRRKDELDVDAAKRTATAWLRRNYYDVSREWAYKDVPRRLVVERLLLSGEQPPPDFKLWVFGGSVELIQVDLARFTQHRRVFFDRHWRPLRVRCRYDLDHNPVARPQCLDQMVRLAETLASDFAFCRVDLYEVDGRVYFGEITHYPGGGTERFEPWDFDRALGDLWRLHRPIPQRFLA